jgi:magnesium-transporting ATPase (P-type)
VAIICSDKTGTLTMNRMTVSHMWLGDQIVEINVTNKSKIHALYNPAFENDFGMMRRPSTVAYDVHSSSDWRKLFRCALLCNRAEFKTDPENMSKDVWMRACTGDASEIALLQYTEEIHGNVMKYRADNKKIAEIRFNSTNKFQLSIHETYENKFKGLLLCMKGAPEKILEKV